MGQPVPVEDMPESMSGTAVPDADLPDALVQPQAKPVRAKNDESMGELEAPANILTGTLSTIAGGYRGLWNIGDALIHGKTFDQAIDQGTDAIHKTQADYTYQPRTQTGKDLVGAFSSNYNPLNWPGLAGQYAGDKLAGAGMPGAGALVNAGMTVSPLMLGLRGDSLSDVVNGKTDTVVAKPRVKLNTDGSITPVETPTAKAPATSSATLGPDTPTEDLGAGQRIPAKAQAFRAQILNDVGFDNARTAAVEGNHLQRATEYQMTHFNEPAGQAAARSFENERDTMSSYLTNMINQSGGTVGSDQGALYARGKAIAAPVEQLKQWYDDKASKLYEEADQQAQGQPVKLQGFQNVLNDPSQITTADHGVFKNAVLAAAKNAGLNVGEDGSISGNAFQAEALRKWLNQRSTPSNGDFVDDLKKSMDLDVAGASGQDSPIYQDARAMWASRQATLKDPKGISSLINEDDAGNRAVPYDMVAKKVSSMDQDQFSHIVNTLKNMPPELQPAADRALGEIKATYLNQMLDASTNTRGGNARPYWNGTAVKNVINANSGKLNALMSPDELGKIDTVRKAGDILSFNPSYPGSAAQAANAVKQGLMSTVVKKGMSGAGAVAGNFVGGPVVGAAGAMAGDSIGNSIAGNLGQSAALRKFNNGSVTLDEIINGAKKP